MDRDSLYSMKVSQLRILCKEKRLLVSGNKEALIARILEDSGISVDSTASSDSKQERTKGDRDAAIDRLLARVEGGESNEKELPTPPPPSTPDSVSVDLEQLPESDVVEAEVFEADIIEEKAPETE